jgi:hypothetical protein
LLIHCVYELRFSEDEAQRRCRAARVARHFPILFEIPEERSIHLTGILLLSPPLPEENHGQLLARAHFRRKREIEKLVAEIAPWSDVPALVEPLGSSLSPWTKRRNTWARTVPSSEGYVRALEFGDGPTQAPRAPADWVAAVAAPAGSGLAGSAPEGGQTDQKAGQGRRVLSRSHPRLNPRRPYLLVVQAGLDRYGASGRRQRSSAERSLQDPVHGG